MKKEKPAIYVRKAERFYSGGKPRMLLSGFFLAAVGFILFIWFVVDEYTERFVIVGAGLVFILVFSLLQRSFTKIIHEAMVRAQESEARFQSLLENIPVITYINDITPESRTTYVSPQIEKFLGYSQEEFLADPLLWARIIYPEDRERVLAENVRTSATLEKFNVDYRLLTKHGNVVWARDEAIVVRDENGTPQFWLGVWSEITSVKESEQMQMSAFEALTRRTNQLQTASEVSRAATSMLELNELLPEVVELIRGHFEYYYVGIFLADERNESLILSAATGEMGRQMLDSQHSLPIGNSSMVGWCVANNHARIALDVGTDAVRFKNPYLPLTRSELALPLRARGRVIGAMTIQSTLEAAFSESDITALQTMTDQVANAIETARLFYDRVNLIKELESKNAELEQFAYTVSHDLKSPLVTMRGYLGYLTEDARRGDFERFNQDLNRVVAATDTMQALLNDLLKLSKVGRTVDTAEDVDVGEVTANVLELIYSSYAQKQVQIIVADNLPTVRVNRTRMVEVVQNLLVNAMKFLGEQSLPQIEIGFGGMDETTHHPIIFVRDNGIGIEPRYHSQIFGLFNRLNPEMDGTGVGLTLVKRIVEMYGGRIWVQSEGAKRGTTFYFTLPSVEETAADRD
jgi:PAS domain S-box-containing protein